MVEVTYDSAKYETNEDPQNFYMTVEYQFDVNGGSFNCEELAEELEAALALLGPEFITVDEALAGEIGVLCSEIEGLADGTFGLGRA